MNRLKIVFFQVIFLFLGTSIIAQQSILNNFPKINVIESNNPSEGYFFVATKKVTDENGSNYFAIFDNEGTPVFMRLLNGAGSCIAQQPNGNLTLIDGSFGKVFFELDSMFQVIDTFQADGYLTDGHDFDMDEDGHVLILGTENVIVDMSAVVDGGEENATIKDKLVQEFDENGNLLYTWKALEHYDILDANENSPFVDLTASTIDYIHANSLCFDSDTSFLFSARHFDEITKIDRRTGEIIWRLGGKKNDFTFINDDIGFSHQHTIRKLQNGNIQFFDNGNMNSQKISSVVEYELNEVDKIANLVSRTVHKPFVYSSKASGQQKLDNGNILVYWGTESPSFTEFNPDGSVALEMDFSHHSFSNRILKSTWNHKVFEPHTKRLNFGMWDGYTESQALLKIKNNTDSTLTLSSYSTKTDYFRIEDSFPLSIPANGERIITVVYFPENAQTGYINDILTLKAEYPDIYIAQQVQLTGKLEDNLAPSVTITPATSWVDVNAQIEISFSEAVRFLDDTELNYLNIDSVIQLKMNNEFGGNVSFNANINSAKNKITLKPTNPLADNQEYFISFGELFEDYSNNSINGVSQFFSTGLLTDVETQNSLQKNIAVFPNPAKNNIHLIIAQAGNYRIVIRDIYSKLIFEQTVNGIVHESFDLTNFSSGLYIVLVYKQNKLYGSRKIILE